MSENVEKYKEMKKVSDEIIEYITDFNKKVIDTNQNKIEQHKLEPLDANLEKKDYNKKVEEYNKKIRKEKLVPQLFRYNYGGPHIANFTKNDYVINLMGINPNISKEIETEKDYEKAWQENKEKDKSKYKSDKLDIYYLPNKANILSKEENKKDKSTLSICNNTSFVDNQYNFWIGKDSVFDNFVKMSWQKYDREFLEEFYDKNVDEFNDFITEKENKYNELNTIFEKDKYFIFTNLLYVSNPNQDKLDNFLGEPYVIEKVRDMFYKQLEYYNSTLIVVANSKASDFVKEYILEHKDKWKWEKVPLEKDYSNFSNLYKLKDEKKYVYLTSRYWYRKDEFTKNLYKKEMKKVINYIDKNI
jgi:hypothetical protein